MTISDKTKERIRKIIELAKRGEGGEKKNAEKLLQEFLDKTGLALADFEDDAEECIIIDHSENSYEKILAFQILSKIKNVGNVTHYNVKRSETKFAVDLTRSEKAEFDIMFEIYRRELKEEMSLTLHAFIQKNEITPDLDADGGKEKPDNEKIEKVLERFKLMEKIRINKAIE